MLCGREAAVVFYESERTAGSLIVGFGHQCVSEAIAGHSRIGFGGFRGEIAAVFGGCLPVIACGRLKTAPEQCDFGGSGRVGVGILSRSVETGAGRGEVSGGEFVGSQKIEQPLFG